MKIRRRQLVHRLAAATAVGAVVGIAPRQAHAGEIEATAQLDMAETRVGEGVVLSLTIRERGSDHDLTPPVPDAVVDNFEIANESSGNSAQISFGSAGRSRINVNSRNLLLIPLKAGEYDLGFSVEVDGKTIESNVPKLKVLEADVPDGPAESEDGLPTEAVGDIFMWASTDAPTVYVGQQVTYALDIYERRAANMHLRKPPTFTDFFSEELPLPKPRRQAVAGIPYNVDPAVRRALFPQRAGKLAIGAAEASLGFRRRLQSKALTVEVLPLPGEGQPANFSPNNVGKYTITTSVDRTEIDPGDPFTLTVSIAGTGNIKYIDPGRWPEVDGARRYDPKVDTKIRGTTELGGQRVYEFLMIAETPGTLTIPEHAFDYFDPETERYERATATAIELTVSGDPVAATDAQPASDASSEDDERLAEVVGGETLPVSEPRSRWLTTTRWVYGMLAVPVLAAAGLGGLAALRRFGPDERSRARARDKMRRQLRLKAAEDALESGEGFHGTLSKMLHELAVRRAGPDGVGLPRPELLGLLAERDVASGDLDHLRELLDECDAARFAAQGGTVEDRRALLDRAMALVRSSSLSKEGS